MKKVIFLTLLLQLIIFNKPNSVLYSQDYSEDEDDYLLYGFSEGIIKYADQNTLENYILETLNKGQKERKEFIEKDLLVDSGFNKTANAMFRKTTGGEKALSVLHGVFGIASLGLVPMKPFFKVEHDRLLKGETYNFYAVLMKSELANVSLEVQKIMELEYKLQIEFLNGLLISKSAKYYTEENIEAFERLILSLPDDNEDIKPIKERFLNTELPKIKSRLHRHLNPPESYIQARENF